MKKHFCDCCGKEIKTWFVFNIVAQCDQDHLGRVTIESFAHNLQRVHEPQRIFCTACKDRAMETLKPPKEV